MSTETNKTLTHRLFDEGFNKGNTAVAHEIIAAEYVDHSPIPAPTPGPAGFQGRMDMLRAAFVERATFGDFFAEGDLVAFPWSASGVHKGTFAGVAPTGKQVTLNGINIERFKDGKIVEHWSQFDTVGLLRQMGALPPPQKPG